MKNRTILITGPKQSGKSTCARSLEKITGAEAVDLDDVIERQTGKTPRALFKDGQEIFRRAEAVALASLIRPEEECRDQRLQIIAAGGGLIDNIEALALLSRYKEIITVYLDVLPETAWARILRSSTNGELPPFLNTENPRETHLYLHKRRSESYKAMAHLIISAENKSPEEIAGEIAKRLELFS